MAEKVKDISKTIGNELSGLKRTKIKKCKPRNKRKRKRETNN